MSDFICVKVISVWIVCNTDERAHIDWKRFDHVVIHVVMRKSNLENNQT